MRSSGQALLGALTASLLLACHALSGSTRAGAPPSTVLPRTAVLPQVSLTAADPRIGRMGRTVVTPDGHVEFGYPGVTLRVCFEGTGLWVTGSSSQGRSHLGVAARGEVVGELVVPASQTELLVWSSSTGQPVEQCLDLVHLTETWLGVVRLSSFRVEGELVAPAPFPERRLLFICDSVTCGEAVRRSPECSKDETWWDARRSYGALAARLLDAQHQLVCFGGKGMLRDWEGRSNTLNGPEFFPLAIADERGLDFEWSSYVPDAVVISLGTNDFNTSLGAFPSEREFVSRYLEFLGRLRQVYPDAHIWVTEGAIVADAPGGSSLQARQKTTLRAFLERVVTQTEGDRVHLLPVEHQPGDSCDAHPTAAQHELMAREVAAALRKQLGW